MIKISDLYVWYDKEFILENVNLQLTSGEIYALIGKMVAVKLHLSIQFVGFCLHLKEVLLWAMLPLVQKAPLK